MSTYRKPLYDNNGDIIIPAMAGDETGWVKTNDIANGAVTTAKIADGNITPAKLSPALSSYICAKGQSGWHVYSSGGVIDLSTTISSRGNFTLSSNCVVVGAGITAVRISCNVYCNKVSSDFAFVKLQKNGSEIKSCTSAFGSSAYTTVSFTPFIVSVAQNDKIRIIVQDNQLNISESEGYMLVEAIA